jgi:hypothetical protein
MRLRATGEVPQSDVQGPLATGSYSFQAVYSGDTNYSGSTSSCEPLTVSPGSSSTVTRVFDAATRAPWTGTETTGASAFDTATVRGATGDSPTGAVTYSFFTTADCSGTAHTSETVDVAGGAVPNSGSTGALEGGPYSFLATYSGDASFHSSTAACEPFTVAPATSVPTAAEAPITNVVVPVTG